jgi:hypothetical protein
MLKVIQSEAVDVTDAFEAVKDRINREVTAAIDSGAEWIHDFIGSAPT